MQTQVPSLQALLGAPIAPWQKAETATQVLRAGATEADLAGITAKLDVFRPLGPRSGPDAAPFLAFIAATSAAGHEELASALGIVMRGLVVPFDPEGPAGRYLTKSRITDLHSREVLWRTGRALRSGPVYEALRHRYANLFPYWKDPRDGSGARVLVLNRLPNLNEQEVHFVHNQSNLPHAYAEVGLTEGFAFDVFFLIDTDFEAAKATMARPDVIYNNVLSAEVLALEGLDQEIKQIADHFDVPLINAPDQCASFSRVANYERIGTQKQYFFPKTRRFDAGYAVDETANRIAAEFAFPVILRDLYGHMGGKMILAQDTSDVVAALEQLQQTGAYAIQYHDYPQPDGLYYRYRMFKIGDEVFASRIHVAQDWNVHGTEHDALKESRPDLDLAALEVQFWEEPETLVPPKTWRALEQMLRDSDADTIGCDFTLDPDGRALIFEINGSMHVPTKGRAAFERLCGFR